MPDPVAEEKTGAADVSAEIKTADDCEGEKKYSKEELETMTVKRVKEIAAEKGCVITKVIKDEVIREFLAQQG